MRDTAIFCLLIMYCFIWKLSEFRKYSIHYQQRLCRKTYLYIDHGICLPI